MAERILRVIEHGREVFQTHLNGPDEVSVDGDTVTIAIPGVDKPAPGPVVAEATTDADGVPIDAADLTWEPVAGDVVVEPEPSFASSLDPEDPPTSFMDRLLRR